MTAKHKSNTPTTDALCSDKEIERRDVPPRVWREMARLERDRARLIAELSALVKRCDGEEGVRADGSNIQTMAEHALLDELGEDEAT